MNRADLLAQLRDGIGENEWAALADGKLRVSAFNRAVLLELRQADAGIGGEVDTAKVMGLRGTLEDYLGRWLPEAPEAWPWIVTACLYLTFIAERPMHPIGMLHIVRRTEGGRIIHECPAKSYDPGSACSYCVCRGLPRG